MGLRSDVQSELAEAFLGDLADVVQTFVFLTDAPTTDYDPIDDDYNESAPTESASKGIMLPLSERELSRPNIKPDDQKLICNGSDVLITPKVGQQIKMSDDSIYFIRDPGKLPGGAATAIVWKMIVSRNDPRS